MFIYFIIYLESKVPKIPIIIQLLKRIISAKFGQNPTSSLGGDVI